MSSYRAVLAALLFLVACGEKFPDNYKEYDFTRDGMFSAFDDDKGMTALYDEKQDVQKLIADWDTKLKAKGYKQVCEKTFDDKSVLRGYVGDKRFLFTGGKLGQQSELHLTVVPSHVKEDQICPPADK